MSTIDIVDETGTSRVGAGNPLPVIIGGPGQLVGVRVYEPDAVYTYPEDPAEEADTETLTYPDGTVERFALTYDDAGRLLSRVRVPIPDDEQPAEERHADEQPETQEAAEPAPAE